MSWSSDFYRDHRLPLLWSFWSSAGLLLLTLVVVVVIVARLPRDYFAHFRRQPLALPMPHSFWHRVGVVLKNLAGGLLVLLGVALIFGPGQGMLAILTGLMLMNFPGKYRLERWLASRRTVWRTLCWLRRRTATTPLDPPVLRNPAPVNDQSRG